MWQFFWIALKKLEGFGFQVFVGDINGVGLGHFVSGFLVLGSNW